MKWLELLFCIWSWFAFW